MSLIDLFYPTIPHKKGRVVMQNILFEENEVEKKKRIRKEYERRYREKNRTVIYEKIAAYNLLNPEKVAQRKKDWALRNKDRMKAAKVRYRGRNAIELARKAREDRAANPELYKARRRANYLANRSTEMARTKARRERLRESTV